MSGKSPTDRLFDGFTPSAPPPAAADGGPQLEPAPTEPLPPRPISICELGPCSRYHELAARLDAQEPLDGSKQRLPVLITRTCYPSPGIEMAIEAPVKSCSIWDPLTSSENYERQQKQTTFRQLNPDAWRAHEASWGGNPNEEDTTDGDR